MHVSLYRKYRPKMFREIVGQNSAVEVIRASYLGGRLGHAYMFSGPRGCGKTTAARLLAKIVNCANVSADGEPCCECESCGAVASGNHMDVMEIDGASNRGIDQIRELKSHVGLSPFMGGMKVYILDEVHMLTTEAFNALLKTLEEPPSSVMFIFATTEPHKVPATIRSRCQHIPFHRITTEIIAAQMATIAEAEGVNAEKGALWEIARSADGALRDAISLFEQAMAIGHGDITPSSVEALFGGGGRAETERLAVQIREHPDEASATVKRTLDLGVSPERFLDGLFPLLRDMWMFALWGEKSFEGASLSDDERDFLRRETPNWDKNALKRAAAAMASLYPRARYGLKNDVFSGLLLFELMGALDAKTESLNTVSPSREYGASPSKEYGASPSNTRGAPQPREYGASLPQRRPREESPDIQTPKAQVPNPSRLETLPDGNFPPKERGTSPPSTYGASPPKERGAFPSSACGTSPLEIASGDPLVAAALIDVRVFMDDGVVKFDFSGAAKAAEAVLNGAGAMNLISRAFGNGGEEISPMNTPEETVKFPDIPGNADTDSRTLETISARLGADILVARKLEPDDTEAGETDDEQF